MYKKTGSFETLTECVNSNKKSEERSIFFMIQTKKDAPGSILEVIGFLRLPIFSGR
jgi:hypothetical protein